MPRSPELRGELGNSLDAGEIHDVAKQNIEEAAKSRWMRDQGRGERIERQYEEERETIVALEASVAELREQAVSMDDEEFERRFVALSDGIREAKGRILRYEHEQDSARRWARFVDMKEIGGYGEFIEKWPMYWMPRKEEVARILSVAKQMRAARGAEKGEPLRILEIGGANAALADLMADLAEENGLEVKYDVVDPEKETVTDAAMAHVGDKRFSFHAETAGQFAMKANEGDERMRRLLADRERLKTEGEVKLRDLRTLAEVIRKRAQEGVFDEDEMLKYMGILEQDFGITLPHEAVKSGERFALAVAGGYDEETYKDVRGSVKEYFARLQKDIEAVTQEIETALMEKPPAYDLVVNAWMPPHTDFTKDIRVANGAAVVYVIETWGATGVQENAGNMGEPKRLGEEDSYGTGRMYRMESGWVGHSLPEVRRQERDGSSAGFRSRDEEFCNAFLIQRRADIGRGKGMLDPDPERAGIKVSDAYLWEKELTKKQGDIAPVIPITKQQRDEGSMFGGDYHDDLTELADRLLKERKKKR